MTTEEIVDPKTGQKLVKQKRKPKAEKPAVTAESEVPKGSKKKMKQTDLPGTEPKRYPDIDEAAEALAEIRGERMDLTRKETEAASILMARMKKHNVRDYEFGKIEAHIEVTEENVKVKIHKDDEEDA